MVDDFRALVQTILNQSSSRFFYVEHDARHYIICRFTSDDDAIVIGTLLESLRDNQGLLAMTTDDYRWEGASMISFTTKDDAALFYLCCPH